jgi:hypothetical protein
MFPSCVGQTVPALAELALSACGWKKFVFDTLGDHVRTCTAHSGVKKAHDWAVDQLADLFRTTHKIRWLGTGVNDVGTSSWLVTSRTLRVRCLWCWTSASPTTDSEVVLTLVLMDTYIALMILIGRLMSLPLTKLENIVLIIIAIPLMLTPLCLLLLVRLGGYTVNVCAFYFYKLIGKLNASFQLQEFRLRNTTVTTSTSSAQPTPRSLNRKSVTSSIRLQHYGLF